MSEGKEPTFNEVVASQEAFYDQITVLKRNYDKTPVARRTRGYVSRRIESADEIFNLIRKNDNILRQLPIYLESDYAGENLFEKMDEFYSAFSGEMADVLYTFDHPTGPQPSTSAINSNERQAQGVVQDPMQTMFKLPQITLPTFSGDYASWSAFNDMFTSLIHSNNSLSNVQKLHYLKSNLRGAASNLLRNTTITNDNYQIAWTTLKNRFANKKALVDVQLSTLINQSSHHVESSENIRELIDITSESLNALRGLNVNIVSWDPLLLYIIIQKLSKETHKAWESEQQGKIELPTFAEFITFLENRFRMLETISNHQSNIAHQVTSRSVRKINTHNTQVGSTSTKPCPICCEHHLIRVCPKLLQMNVAQRRNAVAEHRVCFNCLLQGHMVPDCKNRMRCQKCNKKHHSLLHQDNFSSTSSTNNVGSTIQIPSTGTITSNISSIGDVPSTANTISHTGTISSHTLSPIVEISSASTRTHSSLTASTRTHSSLTASTRTHSSSNLPSTSFNPPLVLLATAIINAVSSNGQLIPLRALIDQGSEVSLLTSNAAQILRLKSTHINLPLSGVGQSSAGSIRHMVNIEIKSQHNSEFSLRANTFIIKNITGMIPRSPCTTRSWPHIQNKLLADPKFDQPGRIDILMGSDIFKKIILPGVLHGEENAPVAQNTVFGWMLSGDIEASPRVEIKPNLSTLHSCIEIDNRLKTFWEIEEVSNILPHLTDEEVTCEEHFSKTHTKSPNGRYVVRLPLRSSSHLLGESRTSAMHRLFQIERSLNTKPIQKSAYIEFMREYIALGHMRKTISSSNDQAYFIPHHAVFKENSSTTKTRVVFDASHKTSSGHSLNDLLMNGPKIQDNLSTILLRWRKYPIAITSDVEKMYRQILVHPDDQRMQHILWRESTSEPICEYALQTVTYGTSCAPFLAVRTLQQLSIDNEKSFPEAAKIIREDFYVDDMMSGAYNEVDAIFIYRQTSKIMLSAGLKLRKWVSNSSAVLDDIPLEDREIQHPFNIDKHTVTALGIVWNPVTDAFNFKVNIPNFDRRPTKRNILSDISKLFDPLGWLAPVIVRSKILMQSLWVKGVGWDEDVPEQIISTWNHLREDLYNVNHITINRWISYNNISLELHGFSDASTHAYSAVVYARIQQPNGQYIITLLTAKTRVSPLKQISIPRLELCGAVLLTELLQKTKQDLRILNISITAWTDSTIVLHWIRAEPRSWKTFVANRVSTIQQQLPIANWHHVPTADNPADCASRGLDAKSLRSFALWWEGPTWLKLDSENWPVNKKHNNQTNVDEEEERRILCNVATTVNPVTSDELSFLQSFSSIGRLTRITSLCKRFIMKCRKTTSTLSNWLSAKELQESLLLWIKISQRNAFHHEIQDLQNKRKISSKSKLLPLNPFLDDLQILRVGGRLHNSNLAFNEKHPMILSNKCHLTTIIIRLYHIESMHGGPQLVLGLLRKKYWIVNARDAVRHIIHRCIICHRYNAENATQLMGNLPEPRINITRPFTNTGVDYAGPINLRMSKGRGNASYKGYISLFICLCTKAIHIEAVSDLTSTAFIAAYRRFVARRGLPAHIYSDNGTNFVGADKILRKAHESILMIKSDIVNNVAKNATEWHFIPPQSPHFGGLWEAGVKSLKHHLKRTIGDSKLTYEELTTLLTQIEACLNSRPLAPLTSDPQDLTALTPGHFLTGDALLAAPDRISDSLNSTVSLISRWHQVQKMYQTIALRWQSEYLSRLQQRPKWLNQKRNIEVGDLVLIKDLNLSPAKWPLARVVATHPGTDKLVRVVTLQTSESTFKRCITKLSLLPFYN